MDGADHGQREPVSMEANQSQLEFLIGQELGQLKNYKFDARVILKKGDKPLQADGLWFEQSHPQAGR
jgi:hypothetical protein